MAENKPKELAFDQLKYETALGHLNSLLQSALTLSDIWHKVGVLPEFTKEEFDNVLQHGARYIEDVFKREAERAANKALGSGWGRLLKPDSMASGIPHAIVERIRSSFTIPNSMAHSGMLEFKNGTPFIPEKAKNDLKALFTAYDTQTNKKLMDAGLKAEKALNELKQVLDERAAETFKTNTIGHPVFMGNLVGGSGVIKPQEDGLRFDTQSLYYGTHDIKNTLPEMAEALG